MGKFTDRMALFFALLPLLVVFFALIGLEPFYWMGGVAGHDGKADAMTRAMFSWLLEPYEAARNKWLSHPWAWSLGGLGVFIFWLLAVRQCLIFWNEQVRPRILKIPKVQENAGFPVEGVTLDDLLAARAPGDDGYVIGKRADGTVLTVTDKQRSTQTHVLGQIGSGKTKSVILPLIQQDMNRGKAVVFIDGKGSADNLNAMVVMAERAGRLKDLKIFSLPYPRASHTYNPVYPTVGGALSTAQIVFSAFTMDNEYYRGQSQIMFQNLVKLAAGSGLPFTLQDINLALTNDGPRTDLIKMVEAREKSLTPSDRDWQVVQEAAFAAKEIPNHLMRLGQRDQETFTGLDFNLRQFAHPLMLANNPDIVLADDLNAKKILYFQLPSNMFKELAPAIGKIVLQQLQQVGAMRQVDNRHWHKDPVAIFVDEFYNYAYEGLITALNMLRDADFQFLLAHQDMSDLARVSKEFADGIAGNTRLKIVLAQQSHVLAETISKTIGTEEILFETHQKVEGALLTTGVTGAASGRRVEAFILHPNSLKRLAPAGQAYVIYGTDHHGVNLPLYDPGQIPDDLKVSFEKKEPKAGLDFFRKTQGTTGSEKKPVMN